MVVRDFFFVLIKRDASESDEQNLRKVVGEKWAELGVECVCKCVLAQKNKSPSYFMLHTLLTSKGL